MLETVMAQMVLDEIKKGILEVTKEKGKVEGIVLHPMVAMMVSPALPVDEQTSKFIDEATGQEIVVAVSEVFAPEGGFGVIPDMAPINLLLQLISS